MAVPFACRLALITFAVISLRGVVDGNDFVTTTKSALLYGALFWGFGWVVGGVAGRLMEEAARTEFERTVQEQLDQSPELTVAAE